MAELPLEPLAPLEPFAPASPCGPAGPGGPGGPCNPCGPPAGPLGPCLPGRQAELEADYREVLGREFGIVFNKLFTITNQPIGRFAEDLRTQGKWDEYLELLAGSFNPATADGLMCRITLSVGYRGELYDCDFNQMLGMSMSCPGTSGLHLWDVTPELLENRAIQTGIHCFACTDGCGSSCTGALA